MRKLAAIVAWIAVSLTSIPASAGEPYRSAPKVFPSLGDGHGPSSATLFSNRFGRTRQSPGQLPRSQRANHVGAAQMISLKQGQQNRTGNVRIDDMGNDVFRVRLIRPDGRMTRAKTIQLGPLVGARHNGNWIEFADGFLMLTPTPDEHIGMFMTAKGSHSHLPIVLAAREKYKNQGTDLGAADEL